MLTAARFGYGLGSFVRRRRTARCGNTSSASTVWTNPFKLSPVDHPFRALAQPSSHVRPAAHRSSLVVSALSGPRASPHDRNLERASSDARSQRISRTWSQTRATISARTSGRSFLSVDRASTIRTTARSIRAGLPSPVLRRVARSAARLHDHADAVLLVSPCKPTNGIKDFPEPIPILLREPWPNSISARTQFRVNSRPEHQRNRSQRSYSFNFGNMGWSPTFSVQVGP